MTHHHRLFSALVIHGALLGGCYEEETDDSTSSNADSGTEETASADTGTSDTGPGDTGTAGTCGDAECLATDDFQACTADGVQCCWAAGDCCDYCCGHLNP